MIQISFFCLIISKNEIIPQTKLFNKFKNAVYLLEKDYEILRVRKFEKGGNILYFIGMVWCFLGVAIIADLFMAAIDQVTSATKIIKKADGKRRVFKVW